MRRILVASVALLLFGCADSHKIAPVTSAPQKLSTTGSVYVARPEDGLYANREYSGSGRMTAQIVANAFAKHIDRTETGSRVETREEALASAKKLGATYLVLPQILHWEDRATEWSAIPDKVEVKLSVISAASNQSLAGAVISAKSGLWTLGGDHPQDLLPLPIEKFVKTLY